MKNAIKESVITAVYCSRCIDILPLCRSVSLVCVATSIHKSHIRQCSAAYEPALPCSISK